MERFMERKPEKERLRPTLLRQPAADLALIFSVRK